jgi:hypothetical protein
MFLWKYIDIDSEVVKDIQERFLRAMPVNNSPFQNVDIDITDFLGLEIHQSVLIQISPNTFSRIHTDWRPKEYGDQLALNIPLINCENSVTSLWESSDTTELQYTDNRQPYNSYDPAKCTKLTEFRLTRPVIFRTDIPHNVTNSSNEVRKAISIRFKRDPWELVNE